MASYKKRRNYDRQFKQEAVRMVQEQGRTVKSVAEDLGIHPGVLSRWRRQFAKYREGAFPGKGHLSPQEEEIARLKRRVADLEEERDILKKAMAFFAKRPE